MIVSNERKRYHRVATVRRLEGMSSSRAAARLGVPLSHVERLEDEYIDLPLSLLYAWQRALDVPLSELVIGGIEGTPEGIWDRETIKSDEDGRLHSGGDGRFDCREDGDQSAERIDSDHA